MEAAELGVLMFCICLFGTLLYSSASPLEPLGFSRIDKGFLMGIAVAITTFLIIRLRSADAPARTSTPPSRSLISILVTYTVGTRSTTLRLSSLAL